MGGVWVICEMESGLSGAILRHANFFACEVTNLEFFLGNSGFRWRIILLCPPLCGTANAVSERGERQGVGMGLFHTLLKAVLKMFKKRGSNDSCLFPQTI